MRSLAVSKSKKVISGNNRRAIVGSIESQGNEAHAIPHSLSSVVLVKKERRRERCSMAEHLDPVLDEAVLRKWLR